MSLGQGRMSEDLQLLQHATASVYSEEEGYYVWGRQIEHGTGVAGSVRSQFVPENFRYSPCPAVYADYTYIVGGTAVAPVACDLGTLYSTDLK